MMGSAMKLDLSEEHLHVIGAALAELPYKVAAPVIMEMNRQIMAQMEPPQEQEPETDA